MQQHTGDNLTFDPGALWKWGDYLTGADNNPGIALKGKVAEEEGRLEREKFGTAYIDIYIKKNSNRSFKAECA